MLESLAVVLPKLIAVFLIVMYFVIYLSERKNTKQSIRSIVFSIDFLLVLLLSATIAMFA